jgi:hypothetical protein
VTRQGTDDSSRDVFREKHWRNGLFDFVEMIWEVALDADTQQDAKILLGI